MSPWESGTTVAEQGRFGCLTGTSSPSMVDWSYCPLVFPAGTHTWSHTAHARQWWSKLEDTVCSSRLPPSPPSLWLERSVGGPEVAEGQFQLVGPCWLQHDVVTWHRGPGCQTATAPSWLLCTSECELFCSETTPEQEEEREKRL